LGATPSSSWSWRPNATRDQLTRDVMAANELLITPKIAALRKAVVKAKAERMLALAG
jgi:predicted lipoprotein